MSEVKVNKISPRSGTTVTLGDSGDTITLASGVSLTGVNATFSGDLTVDTNTLFVDASENSVVIGGTDATSWNANADELIVAGASSGGMTFYNPTQTNIFFADGTTGDDVSRGRIQYVHTDNSLRFATDTTERMRIDSSGNVFIGTTSTNTGVDSSSAGFYFRDGGQLRVARDNSQPIVANRLNGDGVIIDLRKDGTTVGQLSAQSGGMGFNVGSSASEAMRITTDRLLIGSTSNLGNTDTGCQLETAGTVKIARSGFHTLVVNRTTNDGSVVLIEQNGTTEGTISVSGSTVSYGGFTGTHWSRLSDNSKPTILKGTILESLDEMMDWYQVQFDITETDDEGNETTRTEKQSYPLGDGESVGDVITYNYKGTDYQATIIQEGDVKHTKSKISDTVDAKNVYGVFMAWDNDDDTVNDMYVAQTGTFVVRINSAETVSKGDLIQSNGDGTGKVQADDLLRASTVAKVLSTTKIETYDDGSYIVPCSLHC